MPEVPGTTVVQAVLGIVVLCVLIAAAYYVVASFRDYGDEDRQGTTDLLANLHEMHLRGDISDEEFRTMKARTRSANDAVDSCSVDSSSETRPPGLRSNDFRSPEVRKPDESSDSKNSDV